VLEKNPLILTKSRHPDAGQDLWNPARFRPTPE